MQNGNQNETDRRILEVIARSPNCELDEIALLCKDLTWNQVILSIDRLSRTGAVQLTLKRPGMYTVHVNEHLQSSP
jgi:hypothetical protein